MSSRSEYFSKFPVLAYNNTYAIDILKRVRAKDEFKKEALSYYSYSIKQGERPDTVCDAFYDDSYFTWILYLINNYTDPLFEWYKDQQTLDNYIIGKYGSMDEAVSKTAYYRVNRTTQKITKAAYNSLTTSQKKYWTRSFATPQQEETYWRQESNNRDYSQFTYYEITKTPLVSDTNIVVKVQYTETSGSDTLVVGDLIQKRSGGTLVAEGEVASLVDGALYVKHVTDTNYFSSNGSSTSITGTMTVRNKDLVLNVSSSNVVSSSIPIDEYSYWQAISFFDLENEINEARQLVSLVVKEYTTTMNDELRQLLKV